MIKVKKYTDWLRHYEFTLCGITYKRIDKYYKDRKFTKEEFVEADKYQNDMDFPFPLMEFIPGKEVV